MAKLALSKEQGVALNDVSMKGALFPVLFQIIAGVVILLPFLFLYQPDVPPEQKMGAIFLMAIPITVLVTYLSARFVVPVSLFKPRKRGQLLIAQPDIFSRYIWRWVGLCLLVQLIAGVAVAALSLAGITIPGSGLNVAVGFAAAYLANYMVAQRMMNTGDATLEVKSKE